MIKISNWIPCRGMSVLVWLDELAIANCIGINKDNFK